MVAESPLACRNLITRFLRDNILLNYELRYLNDVNHQPLGVDGLPTVEFWKPLQPPVGMNRFFDFRLKLRKLLRGWDRRGSVFFSLRYANQANVTLPEDTANTFV
jgi:hypothetical protein